MGDLKVPMNRCAGAALPILSGDPGSGSPEDQRKGAGRLGAGVLWSLCSCAREDVCDIGPKATDFGARSRRVAPGGAPSQARSVRPRIFSKGVISPLPATTTLGDAKRWLAIAPDGRTILKPARERDASKATNPCCRCGRGVRPRMTEEATPTMAYAGTQVALALSYL
jgi:hypothetical protein